MAAHPRNDHDEPRANAKANPLLEAALAYAAAGIPVFPLIPRDKKPATSNGFKDATTDAAKIRSWWQTWRHANIGVPTGKASGWLAIDIDAKNGATYDTLAALGRLPQTRMAQTPSGGLHLVFAYPASGAEVRNSASKITPGIDVRGEGGYIVVAPSRVTNGQYEWVTDGDQDPAPCPAWLLKLARDKPQPAYRERALVAPTAIRKPGATRDEEDRDAYWLAWALAQAQPGTSDHVGFLLAQQLLLDPAVRDADAVLAHYAQRATFNAHDPFTPRDIDRWLASAQDSELVRRGEPARSQVARPLPAKRERPMLREVPPPETDEPENVTHLPTAEDDEPPDDAERKRENRTDMGNARRFVARHGRRVRYVRAWDKWLVWDGSHWQDDETGECVRMAKETAVSIWDEVSGYEDEAERKEHAKHAARSESDSRLKAMMNVASTEPEIVIATSHLDADTWLLNTQSGTLELRTGQLRAHRQTDLCAKITHAGYDADLPCPHWLRFLDTIFAGNAELIAYVQRACGYALTGEMSEQCLFVLYGSGANGKSTFLDVLTRILGDYAMTTPTDTLMEKHGQNIPSDVARLMGARFVAASESGDGRRLDEELIKRISGGDKMAARFMHHDWFEFYPVLKLFMAVNHKPTIRGTDNGIWRRIHLWPFEVTIPPEQQDKRLTTKLLAEAPAILAWMVRGCLAWQRDGLNPPDKVLQAVQEYREEMDPFGAFVMECCELKPTALIASKALLERYKQWCEDNGERELSAHKLGAYLREKCGCQPGRDTRGARAWIGLTIKRPDA